MHVFGTVKTEVHIPMSQTVQWLHLYMYKKVHVYTHVHVVQKCMYLARFILDIPSNLSRNRGPYPHVSQKKIMTVYFKYCIYASKLSIL